MNWDQDFVTVAVDPHRVIVILVFVGCWRELDVDVLGDTSWDHSLLLIANLEVVRLRWQYVKSLWRRRIINQS